MSKGSSSMDGSGSNAETAAKDRHAPEPEDERKPDSPTKLTAASWKYALGRSTREFSRLSITDLGASLAYYGILSLFPALLALVSLLGIVGQAESTTQNMLEMIGKVASPEVSSILEQPIEQLANNRAAGLTFLVGLLGALWSASGYVGAFGRCLNRIYAIAEGRPFYKLKPLMLLLTAALLVVVALMAILLVVSGPFAQAIGDTIGAGSQTLLIWNIAKWPVLAICAVGLVTALYCGTPNIRQPKVRWLSAGSATALLVLALATLGFFFYVANFGSYNKTYGTIGGAIVLLLWLWIANLSLLFGAVLDAEIERARELQGGISAERSIQLPPRDTTASDKALAKENKDIERAAHLRTAARQSKDN
ncbi:ribonuclease BN [Arthrobacter sp. MYb227]|uniref:YihY/virulence factor BrkB family protein n=1 Tax=Arthrobacter sp. MYb227 TaxID=1848601 RepID=UPI000CFC01D9|nr:YihY/virulence factor BrkB family protein [Arthrobacter sp. MYb227]PQZ92301.1 ribonuclease BN [Arthrobacter sp. MYb227]